MQHGQHGDDVDAAMQFLPAPPSQFAKRGVIRGQCQRQQQEKCGHAHRDEGALQNILRDGHPVEKLIEPKIGCQMQNDVEEGEQTQHAPQPNQPGPAGILAQGCDGQRNQQEVERPCPQPARHGLDRVGAQRVGLYTPEIPRQRQQAGNEDGRFEPGGVQNFFLKSMPL